MLDLENVVAIVQRKLAGNAIAEAGLVEQAKKVAEPKTEAPAVT
jgi:hypothetical protein